jgi:hypothetical protein
MSSPSRTSALAILIAAAATLGGCSDIYYDRRESIAVGAGDAIETNKVTQVVDPWPPYVNNRNFAFNGQRMQAAHERYRHNKVITPVNVTTSSTAYQKAQQDAAAAASATNQATSAAPAAPVRGP